MKINQQIRSRARDSHDPDSENQFYQEEVRQAAYLNHKVLDHRSPFPLYSFISFFAFQIIKGIPFFKYF